MAKALFGGGSAIFEAATSSTIAWPASVTSDMIAVITVSYYEIDNHSFSTPSGFTQRANVAIDGSVSTESRVEVWTKELAGTESGNLTVSFSSLVYATVVLDVFSGDGDLTFTSISSANLGTTTDATVPSVSGTEGQLLVCCFGLTDPPGTVNAVPSGTTIGTSAALTTNYARNYWKLVASTVATGVLTWDFTSTRNSGGLAMLIADAGYVGGGGGSTELPALTMPPMMSASWGRR